MTASAAGQEVRPGDEMAPLSRTVSQAQIDAYADASGDHNPIHVDPEFARSVGLPGTIAHGMLEMAILGEAVGRWAGGHDRLIELACRFSKPLLPGDTVTFKVKLVAPVAMEVQTRFAVREGGKTVGAGVVTKIIA